MLEPKNNKKIKIFNKKPNTLDNKVIKLKKNKILNEKNNKIKKITNFNKLISSKVKDRSKLNNYINTQNRYIKNRQKSLINKVYSSKKNNKKNTSFFKKYESKININNSLNNSLNDSKLINFEVLVDLKNTEEIYKMHKYKELSNLYMIKDYKNSFNLCKIILLNEPNNIYILFIKGITSFILKKYNISIESFEKILYLNKVYKRECYIILAINYKNINKMDLSIDILEKGIKLFSNFEKAILILSRIYFNLGNYDKSIKYNKLILNFSSNNTNAIIGIAVSKLKLKKYKESLNLFDKVLIINNNLIKYVGSNKIKCHIKLKEYDKAQEIINNIIIISSCKIKAFYYKAHIYNITNKITNSIQIYQYIIKNTINEKIISKSFFNLSVLKFKQRDYYFSNYYISKVNFKLKLGKSIKLFKELVNGCLLVIKKKYDDGIKILCKLNIENLFDKPIVKNQMSFLAYSYLINKNYESSIDIYLKLKENHKLENHDKFNLYILKGIIYIKNNNFDEGNKYFYKAKNLFSFKYEPYLFLFISDIWSFLNKHKKNTINQILKNNSFKTLIKDIIKKLDILWNEKKIFINILYLKAYLLMGVKSIRDSIDVFEEAIKKCEDDNSLLYIQKAKANVMIKQYSNALDDFRLAYNINSNKKEYWIYKSKAYFINRDYEKAYSILNEYIDSKGHDIEIYILMGDYMFNRGNFEQAEKDYLNAIEMDEKNKYSLIQVTKINIINKNLKEALEFLENLKKHYKDYKYELNYQILEALRCAYNNELDKALSIIDQLDLEKNKNLFIFSNFDINVYKGVLNFYLKNYELSIVIFQKSIEIYNGKNSFNNNESEEEELEYIFKSSCDINELYYNMSLCYLFMEKYELFINCLEKIDSITLHDELVKFIDNIHNIMNTSSEKTIEHDISIFPETNRLCGIFKKPKLNFHNGNILKTNLSFCLPKIDPILIDFSFENNLIKKLNIDEVSFIPEAPWIIRNSESINLTNNITNNLEKLKKKDLLLKANNIKNQKYKNNLKEILQNNNNFK